MDALVLDHLCKAYSSRIAVENLSLRIPQGEFFSLLGQNGAGKTTTIRMLCCLTPPTSGDAFLLGNSIRSHANAVKQSINLSPQETAIAPNLTALENLSLIARIYGASRVEAQKKAEEFVESFHLQEYAHTRSKKLSGGLKRRLSIAMALITGPQILFLDEPTLGLDVRARRDLWKMMQRLKGKLTLVLTTHYLEEAEALSDRIAILDHGKLQAMGTVAQLTAQTHTKSLEEAFLALTETEEFDL